MHKRNGLIAGRDFKPGAYELPALLDAMNEVRAFASRNTDPKALYRETCNFEGTLKTCLAMRDATDDTVADRDLTSRLRILAAGIEQLLTYHEINIEPISPHKLRGLLERSLAGLAGAGAENRRALTETA